jgi:tetratricopeptide (TPR) repeat protein
MEWVKTNRIVAGLVFLTTFIVYAMTVSPTVSYWDCGEFIACSHGLMVPHPPGAPFFLLLGRLFTMMPFAEDIALRANFISVLSSSFTIMLLYLIIVHLVREWKGKLESMLDWQTAIFSGVLGALTFAFTHSFWFNAVEAEVYAPSMLFTSLLVYLALVWAEKSDEPRNERYLLIISYLIGLAIGVHLLNVLALPFVIMIYYYKRFDFNIQSFLVMVVISGAIVLFIYPGIVKYLPKVAEYGGAFGLAIVFIGLIAIAIWAINNNKKLASMAALSVFLIIVGYSTYTMIYIRSNMDPIIDENNPETVEKFLSYLAREQYGDHSITDRAKVWRESPNGKNYKSAGEYFWKYQVDKMYVRYFLWQFVGMDENEHDVDPKQFLAIPLILGIFGMAWQFKNDHKHALAVLGLFFMTGLAIVLYLNQPDPQPRERDYSYVGSFFAFSIWVGLGYAGIMEFLFGSFKKDKESENKFSILNIAVFAVLLVLAPVMVLAKNYDTHKRTGRYVAWDYSYNMLNSCEPNAILITNGDNDTFPLWYLQEVDSIRRDVRVVNLSLLNTGWYIQQLRDLEPKVDVRISDEEIDQLGLIPWESKKVSLEVPQSYGEAETQEFRSKFQNQNISRPDKITFKVDPALKARGVGALRIQDYMVLRILSANKWKKPVYFAVTVARSNMLTELQQYMRMDGLAYKIVPFKNWKISPDVLERNLVDIYKYRGLQDSTVYYDKNIQGLLQNYRTAFLQVAEYYARENNIEKVQYLMEEMEKRVPASVIAWTNPYLRLIRDSYSIAIDTSMTDDVLSRYTTERDLMTIGENLYRLSQLEGAQKIFMRLYERNPQNIQALSILINVLERNQKYEQGVNLLENWLSRNPRDTQAQIKLDYFKSKI